MRATYTFGERSIKQLAKVHPTFVEILKTALASPKCPWDITITDGARTLSEQRKLYAQGGTIIEDSKIRADWNLEGNDFKITLTDIYYQGILNRIKYFEINKLFGIG